VTAYDPNLGNVTTSLTVAFYTVTVGTNTFSAGSTGLDDPSTFQSAIRLFFDPRKFNTASRTWVSAGITAVKVTGPGLPAAGIVMAANRTGVCGGDTFLAIANASGSMPSSGTATFTTGFSGNSYALASVLADGLTPAWYSNLPFANRASPNVTDFSALSAFSQYRADILLNTGATVTEFARTLAPVEKPSNLLSAQWNDISPSQSLVSSPAIASAASDFNVQWNNNANAAYVESVVINSGAWGAPSTFRRWSQTTAVNGASALTSRPTSQAAGYPTDTNCSATGSTQYPAMANTSDNRQVAVRTWQGRARRYNQVGWTN
jgi:hypothetical protein